jgi:hypothetical protein
MENRNRMTGTALKAAGGAGAIAAACTACCVSLPVLGTVLASLGLSGIGIASFGWTVGAAMLAMLGLGAFIVARRRRRPSCSVATGTKAGSCANSCKI